MKKCPYCAEEIHNAAIVCKHCDRDLIDKPKKHGILGTQFSTPLGCLILLIALILAGIFVYFAFLR